MSPRPSRPARRPTRRRAAVDRRLPFHDLDGAVVTATATLALLGLLMVYSASITARPSAADVVYLSRHATFLCLAVACGRPGERDARSAGDVA